MTIVITTKEGIDYAALAALKGAVKLESLGLRHSTRRSMRKRAAIAVGLKPNAKHDEVIKALEAKMQELLTAVAQKQAEGETKQ